MNLEQWHHRFQQQARWTADIRNFLFNKAAIHSSARVLEVGVGTGAVLDSLVREQNFNPFGVDLNYHRMAFASKNNPSFKLVQADGNHLPYSDDVFQITFCHYLFLWVKDPMNILLEMQRVTQTGGYIIALSEPDHENRIDYPPPLDKLGESQTKDLEYQGADTALGRRLRALFFAAGLDEVEAGILGAQWSQAHSQPEKTEWMALRSDLMEHLSEDQITTYEKLDRAAYESGERVLFIPTFYAIGRVI
ncbi:MAG: class I SAM-dependent methyltransferase [Brevefilum sp.]